MVSELNAFDNLYYEICNEPYFGGVTLDWQRAVADAIVSAEDDLPNDHLVAQNIANEKAKVDEPVHPAVAVLNFHYADPAAATDNMELDRAIGDDETGFDGIGDRAYRSEAWLFLLAGGSVFSHLDYSYTPTHEAGTAQIREPTPGGGGANLRKQLAFLKRFLEGFDFVKMQPATVQSSGGGALGARLAVLAEPGSQYAIYLDKGGGRTTIRFDMPRGRYRGAWYDPRTGQELRPIEVNHPGGAAALTAPDYKEDIAAKLIAADRP